MQQSVPCERALQLLDVELRQDVILAAATALCRGNIDCNPPSSDGILEKDKRRRGDVDLVEAEKLEKNVVEEADWELSLIADLIEEIEALLIILLHLEAIVALKKILNKRERGNFGQDLGVWFRREKEEKIKNVSSSGGR